MDIPPPITSIPQSPEPSPEPSPLPPAPRRPRLPASLLALIPILTLAFGIGLGYLLWGGGGKSVSQAQIATAVKGTLRAQNPPPQNIKRYDVPVDDDPVLGPKDAPITIIEFSDYQ